MVCFDTRARAATLSIVTCTYGRSCRRSAVASRIAGRQSSLRGLPGRRAAGASDSASVRGIDPRLDGIQNDAVREVVGRIEDYGLTLDDAFRDLEILAEIAADRDGLHLHRVARIERRYACAFLAIDEGAGRDGERSGRAFDREPHR